MESKSRLRNSDEFVENSYMTLSLDEIIKKYQREKIHPAFIFSRFQNLEIHFRELQRRRRTKEAIYKNLSSKLQELEGGHSNILGEISNYLSKLKRLKGSRDEKQKIREKLKGLRKSEDSLVHEMGGLSLKVDYINGQKERTLNEIKIFEKNYKNEMQYVYSNGLVDEAFAWSRLIKPGKSRIAEPLLIAQNSIIPIDKLFNCEYIDAVDRKILMEAKYPDKDEHLVSSEILEKRLEDLPERIKNLAKLIKNAEEFKKIGYKCDENKLYSRLQDLLYERDVLGEHVVSFKNKILLN